MMLWVAFFEFFWVFLPAVVDWIQRKGMVRGVQRAQLNQRTWMSSCRLTSVHCISSPWWARRGGMQEALGMSLPRPIRSSTVVMAVAGSPGVTGKERRYLSEFFKQWDSNISICTVQNRAVSVLFTLHLKPNLFLKGTAVWIFTVFTSFHSEIYILDIRYYPILANLNIWI